MTVQCRFIESNMGKNKPIINLNFFQKFNILSPSLILILLLINLSSKLIFNNDNVEYYMGLFIIYICNLNSVLLIL